MGATPARQVTLRKDANSQELLRMHPGEEKAGRRVRGINLRLVVVQKEADW
jgi:hypothetical protein